MLKSKNNFLENNYYFFRIPITKNYFLLSNIKKKSRFMLNVSTRKECPKIICLFLETIFLETKKQATYFE